MHRAVTERLERYIGYQRSDFLTLFEDDSTIAIEHHAMFAVELDCAGEHAAFGVLPLCDQVFDGI